MNKKLVSVTLGIVALSVATIATAQMKPEDMIKFRQSGFTFMAWNMGKIKAQVVDGAVPYNQNQVAAAASAIAAVANSGIGTLFAPGTEQGTGWKATRVKPEFFSEPEEVRKLASDWVEQANKLAEVAAAGNQDAIKAQFGEVGKACKACHDKYRAEE